MGATADGHILDGRDGRFFGINHLQFLNSPLPQLPAHDAGQWTYGCLVDIRYFKSSRVHFVPRPPAAHGADQGNTLIPALFGEGQLGGDRVDGIHNIIKL